MAIYTYHFYRPHTPDIPIICLIFVNVNFLKDLNISLLYSGLNDLLNIKQTQQDLCIDEEF